MPQMVVNEFGQKVRVYEWEEYQRRLQNRKSWKGDVDLNGKTLVVRHTWGIGDILYMTSALRGLKEKFPKVIIRVICSCPEVLDGNPDVDEVHHWLQFNELMGIGDDMEKEWYWLDYDVPLKGGFDYKIHLRTKPQLNEFLVHLLKKDPKELTGDERDFVDQASNAVITRYRMVALDMYCWHAHVDPPNKSVWYYPRPDELEFAREFFKPIRARGFKPIVLIPHTSTPYKDYPYWKEVVKILPKNYFWVILGAHLGSSGRWIGENVADCSGAFRIRHSAALCIEADLVCSSDTGLTYTRLARGGKAVMTYGPHHWEPFLHYFPSAKGLRVEKLTKTPGMEGMCSSACFIDTSSCRRSGSPAPCLQELDPELVAKAILGQMGTK